MRPALAIGLLIALSASAAGEEHLLAGARHFRDGHFQEAFVEFSVARRLGEGGEAAWYAAATLVKLARPEDALVAFAEADETAPNAHDALLDYYRAMACHDARLYLCAERLLAETEKLAGPRIAGQARKVRGDLAALLAEGLPSLAALDWYHARATRALQGGQPALARLFFAEAAELARLRPDRYRLPEALAGAEPAAPRKVRP